MAKNEVVQRLAFILNRGWGDPKVFIGKKQDDMVKHLAGYLEAHAALFGGAIKVMHCHGLNDKGVDFLLEIGDFKAGFQIKTESDVVDDAFAANVKRQMTESWAHKLDKYYLLMGTPLVIKGKDYSARINHLVSELSLMETPYFAVYPPESTAKFFDGTKALSAQDMKLEQQKFAYGVTTEDLLAKALAALEKKEAVPSAAAPERYAEKKGGVGKEAQSLARMSKVLKWDEDAEEKGERIEDMNALRAMLMKIPLKVRDILVTCVRYSEESEVLAVMVEGMLGLNAGQLQPQLKLLENAGLLYIDTDEPHEAKFKLRWKRSDWPIFDDLRYFCEESGADLDQILVHLDMSACD